MKQDAIDKLKSKYSDKAVCELTNDVVADAAAILAEVPDHPNLINLKQKYAAGAGGGFTSHVDCTDLIDILAGLTPDADGKTEAEPVVPSTPVTPAPSVPDNMPDPAPEDETPAP